MIEKKHNEFSLKTKDTQSNKNLQKKHSRFKNLDLNFKKKNNPKKLKKKNIRIDTKNNFNEEVQFKTKNKEFASKKKDNKNIKILKKKIRSKDSNPNFKTKNKKKSKNLNKKMPSMRKNRVTRN